MTQKINIGTKFVGHGGADVFPVYQIGDNGSTPVGYIKRVFADVYYISHDGDSHRDNRRFRSWNAALDALTQ